MPPLQLKTKSPTKKCDIMRKVQLKSVMFRKKSLGFLFGQD